MSDRSKTRFVVSICIFVTALVVVLSGAAVASSPRTTYWGSVGGKSVIAQKDVIRGINSWNGDIWSHTQDGSAIGTIGWTWWTIRETCTGSITTQYQYGGQALYNASAISDIAVDTISYCWHPPGRNGHVLGTHDFKHGSDIWNPYWEHNEKLG